MADFREHLNLEVIRKTTALFKDDILKWKFKLMSNGNKDIIKKEYDNTMLQLLIYETEFKNAVHLKPYYNLLLEIIEDIRNTISILTLYFKDDDVVSLNPSTIYKEYSYLGLENKFNGVPLTEVRTHFECLTTLRSKKNNKPYITQEQLTQFIKIAFLQENEKDEDVKEKIKMNFDRGELQSIRRVFYEFYKSYRQEYESTPKVKEKYVRLLTDNFEGFDYTKIANNFDK